MNKLLQKIDEILFEYPSQQKTEILNYIKNNIYHLDSYSLQSIANSCHCSTTSITRVVKKLGFSGFREFQINLKFLIQNEQYDTKNYLSYLEGLIDYQIITDFIKFLPNNQTIYIYGKGSSQISAMYLFRGLIKCGLDAAVIQEQDLLYVLHNKTIITISNSGETNSVITTLTKSININNCNVLAITALNSTLANISTFTIHHNGSITNDRDEQIHLLIIINKILLLIEKQYNN